MLELQTFPTSAVLTRRQPEFAARLVHGLTNRETVQELKVFLHIVALVQLVYQLGGDNVGSQLVV